MTDEDRPTVFVSARQVELIDRIGTLRLLPYLCWPLIGECFHTSQCNRTLHWTQSGRAKSAPAMELRIPLSFDVQLQALLLIELDVIAALERDVIIRVRIVGLAAACHRDRIVACRQEAQR